ncbi:DUF397 domain-containing protein [Nocardia inohanensis]|uniref:DUF397 domain-containing protein n=1 Tax=Nocardia inohanensis TaxID=209246 RepID=UPI000B03175A|nr:DUF397 domain-containing protein [Nocardia inohanensis]
MSSKRPAMNPAEPTWRTSSYSGPNGGECVEVAFDTDRVLVRDTKFRRDPANAHAAQPMLAVSPAAWDAFLRYVVADRAE